MGKYPTHGSISILRRCPFVDQLPTCYSAHQKIITTLTNVSKSSYCTEYSSYISTLSLPLCRYTPGLILLSLDAPETCSTHASCAHLSRSWLHPHDCYNPSSLPGFPQCLPICGVIGTVVPGFEPNSEIMTGDPMVPFFPLPGGHLALGDYSPHKYTLTALILCTRIINPSYSKGYREHS